MCGAVPGEPALGAAFESEGGLATVTAFRLLGGRALLDDVSGRPLERPSCSLPDRARFSVRLLRFLALLRPQLLEFEVQAVNLACDSLVLVTCVVVCSKRLRSYSCSEVDRAPPSLEEDGGNLAHVSAVRSLQVLGLEEVVAPAVCSGRDQSDELLVLGVELLEEGGNVEAHLVLLLEDRW